MTLRHCEEQSDEAIQCARSALSKMLFLRAYRRAAGLLRFARMTERTAPAAFSFPGWHVPPIRTSRAAVPTAARVFLFSPTSPVMAGLVPALPLREALS